MKSAVLVIILTGQMNCEPYIRDIPDFADAHCIDGQAAPLAPATSPRPTARPEK